jgi:hypothetical protein
MATAHPKIHIALPNPGVVSFHRCLCGLKKRRRGGDLSPEEEGGGSAEKVGPFFQSSGIREDPDQRVDGAVHWIAGSLGIGPERIDRGGHGDAYSLREAEDGAGEVEDNHKKGTESEAEEYLSVEVQIAGHCSGGKRGLCRGWRSLERGSSAVGGVVGVGVGDGIGRRDADVLEDGEVDCPDDINVAHDDDEHHEPNREVSKVKSHSCRIKPTPALCGEGEGSGGR